MTKHSSSSSTLLKILLSIKPEFVEQIFAGEKTWEFRKRFIVVSNPIIVIIYATKPVQKLVGGFWVGSILHLPIDQLWDRCKKSGGISYQQFSEYFTEKQFGFAILITRLAKFAEPIDPFTRQAGFTPPQSYKYIQEDIYELLIPKECL